ncbi:hydantoinase B/oxoprolinase family protein [Nocardioides sp. NPDC051685]|uniref:hydantoinase B/oxoprolinase family protein n=1 Tax=Nocardioides sp. NPDC051685 TaxID=3364334 RepID=UPI00379C6ADE
MTTTTEHDPVAVEIHRKALENIVNEMAITLTRTSGSPVVYEVQDFATALLDRAGEHLAMSSTLVFHAGSSLMGTRLVIETLGDGEVRKGDGWILNDPFEGGALHQADVAIITPTFYGDEHIGWAFSNVHVADIGGSGVSGFAPSATSVYEEGLRFPATRIIENGVLDPNWERYIANNVRVAPLVLNDLRSMMAASNVAQEKLSAVVDRYGSERFREYCEINKSLTEDTLRSRIELIPDGTYHCREMVEYDGQGTDEVLDVTLALTIEGSQMRLDFEGDDQITALINGTTGVAHGWAMVALLTTLAYGDVPFNAGMWRPITIGLGRSGTIVNAEPPAPVSGAHGTAGLAILRAIKGALNQAFSLSTDATIRSRVGAVGDTSGPLTPLAGVGRGGIPVVVFFMDAVAGIGGGAQSSFDGQDLYGSSTTLGVSLASIETNEGNNPALYLWRRLVKNSGGPGLYRGGQSLETAFSLYDTDLVQGALTMAVAQEPANGVGGGLPGGNGLVKAIHGTNVQERLAARQQTLEATIEGTTPDYPSNVGHFVARLGDVVIMRGGGGAGLGDPLLRDPELVARDVADLYITRQNASAGYGVALTDAGSVDVAATASLREKIRRERIDGEPSLPQRAPVDAGIAMVENAEGWSCASCDSQLAVLGENWRAGAVRRTTPAFERLAELDMWTRPRKEAESIRLTEYFCPSCAAALGTDLHQADAEPTPAVSSGV